MWCKAAGTSMKQPWGPFLWTVREGKRRPKFVWLTLTCRCLRKRNFWDCTCYPVSMHPPMCTSLFLYLNPLVGFTQIRHCKETKFSELVNEHNRMKEASHPSGGRVAVTHMLLSQAFYNTWRKKTVAALKQEMEPMKPLDPAGHWRSHSSCTAPSETFLLWCHLMQIDLFSSTEEERDHNIFVLPFCNALSYMAVVGWDPDVSGGQSWRDSLPLRDQ